MRRQQLVGPQMLCKNWVTTGMFWLLTLIAGGY
jgi:hypothetical protein